MAGGGGAGGGGGGSGGGGGGGRLSLHLRPCGGVVGSVGGDSAVSDYPPSAAAVRSREAAAAALHAARTLLGAGVANPCSPTPEPPFWKMPHKGAFKLFFLERMHFITFCRPFLRLEMLGKAIFIIKFEFALEENIFVRIS